MTGRYQVKFTHPQTRKTHYAIYHGEKAYFSDGEWAAATGKVWVEDALKGNLYQVPENWLVDIPSQYGKWNPDTQMWEDSDEFQSFIQDEMKKAETKSDSLTKFDVGAMFSVGVADGSAYYVVTKVNKRTCRIEWRGFCADRWVDQFFGYGGSFDKAKIASMCRGKFKIGS